MRFNTHFQDIEYAFQYTFSRFQAAKVLLFFRICKCFAKNVQKSATLARTTNVCSTFGPPCYFLERRGPPKVRSLPAGHTQGYFCVPFAGAIHRFYMLPCPFYASITARKSYKNIEKYSILAKKHKKICVCAIIVVILHDFSAIVSDDQHIADPKGRHLNHATQTFRRGTRTVVYTKAEVTIKTIYNNGFDEDCRTGICR